MANALKRFSDESLEKFGTRLLAYSDADFLQAFFLGKIAEFDTEALRREKLRRGLTVKGGA